VGAAIAVGCAWILRGPGGDPISHAAGSGVLTPGRREAASALANEIDTTRGSEAGPHADDAAPDST
jgi:hypothetical protein